MRLSDYDFELPPERIALEPATPRDAARLFVLSRDGRPDEHRVFADLGHYLNPGDLLVLNDTRVMPARLAARRAGHAGIIELLLLRPDASESRWEALARPARRLQPGTRLEVGEGAAPATVTDVRPDGRRVVEFDAGVDVRALMAAHGHMPLPPYIARPDTPADRERYQTVFARAEGAVAAPTAGLHFTPERLAALEEAGVAVARVTLHVGIGTFRPVTAEDPRQHAMEPEWYELPEATAVAWAACRARGGRVVACGTTVVRTLETAAGGGFGGAEATGGVAPGGAGGPAAALLPGGGWTRAFIYPPYAFRAVDALITNFHLPASTLLMLVSALAGRERILAAYAEAIRREYRFYSYGDAMLIR